MRQKNLLRNTTSIIRAPIPGPADSLSVLLVAIPMALLLLFFAIPIANGLSDEKTTASSSGALQSIGFYSFEGRDLEALRLDLRAVESKIGSGDKSTRTILQAAYLSQLVDDHAYAMKYLDSLEDCPNEDVCFVQLARAEILFAEGRWRSCEPILKAIRDDSVLKSDRYFELVTTLYCVENRKWEARQFLREWAEHSNVPPNLLSLISDDERKLGMDNRVAQILSRYPDDPIVKLPQVHDQFLAKDYLKAKSILDQIAQLPDVPQQVLLDQAFCFAKLGQDELAETALALVNDEGKIYPDYWVVSGIIHATRQNQDQSIAALLMAIKMNMSYRTALTQLVEILSSKEMTSGERDALPIFQDRLRSLDDIQFQLMKIKRKIGSKDMASSIAIQFRNLNDLRFAKAWEHVASDLFKEREESNSKSAIETIGVAENSELAEQPLAGLRLEDYPTLEQRFGIDQEGLQEKSKMKTFEMTSKLSFDDVSRDVGVTMTFDNGDDFSTRGIKIFQTYGGGCTVLDMDMDGWPDIYFPQAGGALNQPNSSKSNQLYRNHNGIRFEECTSKAGVDDRYFGQGASSGDVNQDGFQDLYLANIGPNVLWINQGDGTFSRCDGIAAGDENSWTTSGAIADIDGDSLPDIVSVNYVDPREALGRECSDRHGSITCNPWDFGGSKNAFFINDGQGGFSSPAELTKSNPVSERSLAVMIANFDDKNGNDLFIANDAGPNEFLVSYKDANARSKFVLKEEASLRGCAVNDRGVSQACMGISTGDFDRDGRIDIYVTNFINEYNTVYLQKRSGLYADRSRTFGTLEQVRDTVGFGCQAHDLDADGYLDLVVLNGHVDDYLEDAAFEMSPDIWKGESQGFVRLDRAKLGGFFQKKTLGRALASFDFNRDGRMDFIATHIGSPASIVKNSTATEGHRLWLRLIGTTSDRDAVGARIEIKAHGGETWVDMVAKGGYMVSSEPLMHFGIGENKTVEQITVRWPNGDQETFGTAEAGNRYLLIEGSNQAVIDN